ncbi:MAG: hypothetical protein K8E66_09440, partial [Phycisphaerales bacterium]|nr:hypothetical protein [Phycisphaerales bacterium]
MAALASALSFSSAGATLPAFEIGVVDSNSAVVKGQEIDIVIDSGGANHVVYQRYQNSVTDLLYASGAGDVWAPDTVGQDVRSWSSGVGEIEIDDSGGLHVMYHKNTAMGSNRLHHATLSSGDWTSEVVTDSVGTGKADLAVDSTGGLHAVALLGGFTLCYFEKPSGGTWSYPTVIAPSANEPAIEVDGSGVVHVAYTCTNCSGSREDLNYARYESDSWTVETVDDSLQAGNFIQADIAIAPDGTPSIAYQYSTADGNLHFATRTGGGTWTSEVADTGIGEIASGDRVSLEFDSDGNVHVARMIKTFASPYDGGVQYVSRQGGLWESVVVDTTTYDNHPVALALDSSGSPAIAYSTSASGLTNQYEIRVARAATASSAPVEPMSRASIGRLETRGNPFRGSTQVVFQVPSRSSVSLRVHDVTGRAVTTLLEDVTLAPGEHTVRWDGRAGSGQPA